MLILLATDADWIVDEVTAALSSPETSFAVVRDGRAVSKVVTEREVSLAILDLQIGSMGGMAATMDLRLDESSGRIEHMPVLMLLDRAADVNLAKRSGAEGWIVKPLDALRLKRAVGLVANGEPYHEGWDDTELEDTVEEPAVHGAVDASVDEPA